MNDATQQPDMRQIVEDGARYFEDIETKLEKMHRRITELAPTWEKANAAGMMGMLETGELVNETLAIAGLIADANARVYRLHRRGTDIAEKNGVDIPTTRGGGGGR